MNVTPPDIATILQMVSALKSQILTYGDVIRIVGLMMGAMTSILLAATFWWMRYLKEDSVSVVKEAKSDIQKIVKENKDDIREMLKDMLAVRLEGLERRIEELTDSIDALRLRYNSHFDKYHTKDG